MPSAFGAIGILLRMLPRSQKAFLAITGLPGWSASWLTHNAKSPLWFSSTFEILGNSIFFTETCIFEWHGGGRPSAMLGPLFSNRSVCTQNCVQTTGGGDPYMDKTKMFEQPKNVE